MATYTDNYNLIKPTYAETADIVPLNNNFEKIDEVMHSSQVSLAPAFDQAQAYSAGDVVMYELLMYEFTDSKAAGNWDATKVRRTTAAQTGSGSRTYGTASGQPASFPDGSDNPLEACNVDINPVQDLHGYSKPWAGGAGKNILPTSLATIKSINTAGTWDGNRYTILGVEYTVLTDADGNIIGINANGLSSGNADISIVSNFTAPENCIMTGCPADGGANKYQFYLSGNVGDYGNGANISSGATGRPYLRIFNGYNADNLVFYPMIRKSTDSAGFEPYANICPITPRDQVNITVSATQGGSGEDTQIALGRDVYGGTLNVKTGELMIDKAIVTFNGSENWQIMTSAGYPYAFRLDGSWGAKSVRIGTKNAISNIWDYSLTTLTDHGFRFADNNGDILYTYERLFENDLNGFKAFLNTNNMQMVYNLATPLTYTLTPAEVRSILGQNYIEADSGEILVVYIRDLNSCLADILRRLEVLERANSGNRSAGTLSLRGATKTAPDETEEDQKAEDPQEVKEDPQEKPEEDPEEKQPEEEEEYR